MEIAIASDWLWALFLILIIVFIFFGIILSYHWNHYGMNDMSRKVARVVYFFVSAAILVSLVFFIGLYEF